MPDGSLERTARSTLLFSAAVFLCASRAPSRRRWSSPTPSDIDDNPDASFRLVSRSTANSVAGNTAARFVVQRFSDRIYFQITARSTSVGAVTTITSLGGYRCGASARTCP